MRPKIVAANWKMNKDLSEGIQLASEVIRRIQKAKKRSVQVVLIPPFIHLTTINRLAERENIYVGAQNCHEQALGAFTGEISALMLRSVGVTFVIIGHSERRQYFKEDDTLLAKKISIALKHDLQPIFCCGESLQIREEEKPIAFVKKQLSASLFHLSQQEMSKVAIAYEPVWAIGTGKTATPEQAQIMHEAIRMQIREKYGKETADNIPILYGGSCNEQNAKKLFACPDVDGGLIGGASLQAASFISIVNSF
ncbi:MAG: triose-phosphate isomerase [Cytophagales bacterium]|nr:triose-phosphate isomerase [Cytophagales bacterium]